MFFNITFVKIKIVVFVTFVYIFTYVFIYCIFASLMVQLLTDDTLVSGHTNRKPDTNMKG